MSAPTLTTADPTNGAIGVFLNAQVVLTFDTDSVGLDDTQVDSDSFLIRDLSTNRLIELDAELDSTLSIVTLTPKSHFQTFHSYRVFVLGSDTSSSLAVRDVNGLTLATTQTVTFTTGDQLYTHDPELVVKTTEDLTNEGDLFLPSNLKVLSGPLTLVSTSPIAWSHHQSATTISLQFSKDLASTAVNYLTVTFEPMLGEEYLADPTTDEWLSTYTEPTGVVALGPSDNSILTWSATSDIPRNMYVRVVATDEIYSEDGEQFSGADFGFNTQVWPNVGSTFMVRREIPAALEGIRNDYLGFLLLKNTIYCYELSGGRMTLTAPQFAARKYVLNRTIVDVLDDKELEKSLAAGTRRQLGDLNVSVDALVGRASIKHARAEAAAELSLASLIKDSGVRGCAYENLSVSRTWYGAIGKYRFPEWITFQENTPVANVWYNRQAKVPPSEWFY
jgi:hypothetical protein